MLELVPFLTRNARLSEESTGDQAKQEADGASEIGQADNESCCRKIVQKCSLSHSGTAEFRIKG